MRRSGLAFLAAALILASAANAAQKVGTAIDASTRVVGSGPSGNREIIRNTAIFSDDRLRADRTGNAQIILTDNTKIVVGPGAQIAIDDFVFASGGTFEQITVKATKGAFRFISGNSRSKAYRIETPTGTIGVRGTAFDIGIANGRTHVVVVRGAVEMCPSAGRCQTLRGLCSYGVMNAGGVRTEGNLRTGSNVARANFPLMKNEGSLRQQFRQPGDCGNSGATTLQRRAAAPEAGDPGPAQAEVSRQREPEPAQEPETCGRC